MHKILQDKKSKWQIQIYDLYHQELVKLAKIKTKRLEALEMTMNIMNKGWQAFEKGKSLNSNPYVDAFGRLRMPLVNEPNAFKLNNPESWELGYEMAQQNAIEARRD